MVRNGPGQRFHLRAGMAAFLAWMSHTAAFAQAKPVIAVAPLSQSDNVPAGVAARFTQQIAQQLQGRNEVRVASEPRGPVKSPDRAAGLLGEGNRAMEEARFPAALSALKAGIELSFADPSKVDFKKVLDAHAQLAAAAFRLGDDKLAQNTLTTLGKLEPSYKLPEKYPPVFLREWEKAKARVEKLPRHTLVVDGPPGATGFIDGRDLGMVPVDEAVADGRHAVKVEGTRGERFGQPVEVKGGPAKVTAVFGANATPSPAELRVGATLDLDTANNAHAFAKAARAEYVVVGTVSRGTEEQLVAATALYSVAKHGFVLLAPATLDAAESNAESQAFGVADEVLVRIAAYGNPAQLPLTLARRSVRKAPQHLFDKDKVYASHEQTNPPPSVAGEAPSGRWYWWVIGGVAVAAAVGGAAYGISQANRPVTGTVSASW